MWSSLLCDKLKWLKKTWKNIRLDRAIAITGRNALSIELIKTTVEQASWVRSSQRSGYVSRSSLNFSAFFQSLRMTTQLLEYIYFHVSNVRQVRCNMLPTMPLLWRLVLLQCLSAMNEISPFFNQAERQTVLLETYEVTTLHYFLLIVQRE